MTGNHKIGVSVRLANPSGFVAQKNRPETNFRAALAEGDEKQVFFVRCNDKEEMPFGGGGIEQAAEGSLRWSDKAREMCRVDAAGTPVPEAPLASRTMYIYVHR